MWRKVWFGTVAGLAMAAAIPGGASAEDGNENPSGWAFKGGLYGWAIWVDGDVTARGVNFDAYADPVDLIDALDGPIIMANFEAKRGRFAFYADVLYAKFGGHSDFARTTNPIPPLTLTANARVESDFEFGVYQAAGFYEVARSVGPSGNATTVEVGAGARWFRQELDFTLNLDLSAKLELKRPVLAKRFDFSKDFRVAVARSGVLEWVDPVVAARVKHRFGDGKALTAMGDVGGFDTNDDFSWQAIVTYDCDGMLFGYETTTSIGYKALGLKYEEQARFGTRGVDVVLHGPIAELAFRW